MGPPVGLGAAGPVRDELAGDTGAYRGGQAGVFVFEVHPFVGFPGDALP